MKKESRLFTFDVYDQVSELNTADRELLLLATEATNLAYAPYSQFYVGAVARMANQKIISGGNQENASFPAGLCAEGVVLASAGAAFPGMAIDTMAITHRSEKHAHSLPIAPCGICRQKLQEFIQRTGSPIRLLLGSMEGRIFVIENAADLLPLRFSL